MEFDYIESGQRDRCAPAILFLPGSYSTAGAWRGVQASLAGSYRLISTSLPGYGGSAERRRPEHNDIAVMTGFVADVVERVGGPVHLVGHSWGGLVTLASALTGAVAPLSLMTFEANPVYTRPADRVYPWRDEVEAINTRFTEAVATGDPDAAAIIIDYWSTKGAFTAMPPVFQDYCRATVQSNVLDWGGAADFAPAISAFGAVDVPATLVRGAHANAAIADITADIAQALPQGAMEVVEGAGHFLISTHPEACAALIDAHMGRIAARIAASSSGGPG